MACIAQRVTQIVAGPGAIFLLLRTQGDYQLFHEPRISLNAGDATSLYFVTIGYHDHLGGFPYHCQELCGSRNDVT